MIEQHKNEIDEINEAKDKELDKLREEYESKVSEFQTQIKQLKMAQINGGPSVNTNSDWLENNNTSSLNDSLKLDLSSLSSDYSPDEIEINPEMTIEEYAEELVKLKARVVRERRQHKAEIDALILKHEAMLDSVKTSQEGELDAIKRKIKVIPSRFKFIIG